MFDKPVDYKTLRLEQYFRDPVVGDGLLRPPMSGVACRNIRIALRYLGYKIVENDQYDDDLEKKITKFQMENNHTSKDGYVGPGTRSLLTRKLNEESDARAFAAMKFPKGEAFPLVFLSYAGGDLEYARQLYNSLHASGVNIWFNKESLLPGENWKLAIRSAIRKSRFFLALLSKESVSTRGYVQKELKEALEVLDEFSLSEIFLIPIRLNDCEPLDPRIQNLNWVDMFPDWEGGVIRIVKTISSQS